MRLDPRLTRGMQIVLVAALAAASVASPAAADHGRRYKGPSGFPGDWHPRFVQRVHASPGWSYSYSSRSSCGAPAFAGFIGGLIIGSALAHAAPPPAYCAPVAANYYYDPYCHERFSSLDAYGHHLDNCRHPAWVRVIDGNSGRCVGERYWQGGGWRERWDSRDGGERGDDQGDDDPGGDWNR